MLKHHHQPVVFPQLQRPVDKGTPKQLKSTCIASHLLHGLRMEGACSGVEGCEMEPPFDRATPQRIKGMMKTILKVAQVSIG